MTAKPMHLGHVNIFVKNVDRAEKFYSEVVGLTITNRRPNISFLAANEGLSHEIALIGLGEEAPGPDRRAVGLNHMAWQMATFEDLKEVYRRLKQSGTEIVHISDHNVALGIYFRDTEGNENEVYYELPKEQWPERKEGDLFTGVKPFRWSLEDEANVVSPRREVSLT